MTRINPLHASGLTIDSIEPGMRILCWKTKQSDSVARYELVTEAHPDDSDGGTIVVTVEDQDDGQR